MGFETSLLRSLDGRAREEELVVVVAEEVIDWD